MDGGSIALAASWLGEADGTVLVAALVVLLVLLAVALALRLLRLDVREAWLALQSGLYDVALAIGVEKLTNPDPAQFHLLSCAPTSGEAAVGAAHPAHEAPWSMLQLQTVLRESTTH